MNKQTIKKIDGVILALSEGNSYFKKMPELLRKENTMNFVEMLVILERLEDEGYIKSKIDPSNPTDWISGSYYALKHKGTVLMHEGGYKRKVRWEWIENFPKKFWWLLAVVGFLVGRYSDLLSEKSTASKNILRDTIQLKQEIQVKIDTTGIHTTL